MTSYTPKSWFWIVGNDETRAWSSAVGSYVTDGIDQARTTRIASEAELCEVLKTYGVFGPQPLSEIKKHFSALVDADAEATRLKYITPGAGMMLTYQEKFAQATAANAMGETAANAMSAEQRAAAFPLLDASVGIEAASLWDVTQLVLIRYAAFAQLARVIETKRLAGKKSISDASDAASAKAAYEAITWTIS